MGILDMLFGGAEGQLKRHIKQMKNPNAQVEERQRAAEWLADNGSEEAIAGMMGRFTLQTENRMKDASEKEYVMSLLTDLGDKVVGPARTFVKANKNFAFPLQLIDHYEGREAAVTVLLEMLAMETDPFKVEKKKQILLKLAEYADPRAREPVGAELDEHDESIRYAAAEALIALEDDETRPALAKALARKEEESNRLRVRIAEVFAQRGWDLGEYSDDVASRPPLGFVVDGGRLKKG